MRAFPPRLPGQPIFYPVLSFAYAEEIARDWNSTREDHSFVGFVSEFDVDDGYAGRFEPQARGAAPARSYGYRPSSWTASTAISWAGSAWWRNTAMVAVWEEMMREDMHKVLVERPRLGARWKTRRCRLAAPGDLPAKIGVRRLAALTGTRSKHLNEHLGPLRRYLWAQRGRPWDKVHGEMRAVLDPRNEVQAHIMTHLEQFIAIKVRVDRNGEWHADSLWRGHTSPDNWPAALYVDPRDGIIKETAKLCRKLGLAQQRRRPPKQREDDRVVVDVSTELHRLEGIWYRLELGEPAAAPDTGEGGLLPAQCRPGAGQPGRWGRILVKRQLGKADLKRFGLINRA